MAAARQRVVLSWSSGKDSAWALHVLRQDPAIDVVGLLTTFNGSADRVAMHAVRRELAHRQAKAAGLPMHAVDLPWPCPNDSYEAAMQASLDRLSSELEFDAVAFGDLFLDDIRTYREQKMAKWGKTPLFPLWQLDTTELATTMVDSGLRAVLTCVDPRQCPAEFAGRTFDRQLLDDLPDSVDPCGENGEFHTYAYAGPMFEMPIGVRNGEIVERDGFVFSDLVSKD